MDRPLSGLVALRRACLALTWVLFAAAFVFLLVGPLLLAPVVVPDAWMRDSFSTLDQLKLGLAVDGLTVPIVFAACALRSWSCTHERA
jgi:hypothetical protein